MSAAYISRMAAPSAASADEVVVVLGGSDAAPVRSRVSSVASAHVDIDPSQIVDLARLRLVGHSNQVKAVVVLQDGRVASASADTTVRVWDATSARQCVKIELMSVVYCLTVLADGRLVAGLGSGEIVVLQVGATSATKVGALAGHTSSVFSLAAVQDATGAQLVISGSRKGGVKVWDVASGACTHQLNAHTDIVGAVLPVMLDAGDLLATASTDTTIRLWDLASHECIAVLRGHTGAVCALLRVTGDRIASASRDGTVRVWDYRRGSCISFVAHTDAVWALARLPNNVVVSAGDDRRVSFLDVDANVIIAQVPHAHRNIHDLALHPDGLLLCANDEDYSVSQYSLPPALLAAPAGAIERGLSRRTLRISVSNSVASLASLQSTAAAGGTAAAGAAACAAVISDRWSVSRGSYRSVSGESAAPRWATAPSEIGDDALAGAVTSAAATPHSSGGYTSSQLHAALSTAVSDASLLLDCSPEAVAAATTTAMTASSADAVTLPLQPAAVILPQVPSAGTLGGPQHAVADDESTASPPPSLAAASSAVAAAMPAAAPIDIDGDLAGVPCSIDAPPDVGQQLEAALEEAERATAAERAAEARLLAARNDIARLRGVLGALVQCGATTTAAVEGTAPVTDPAVLSVVDRFTPMLALLQNCIRDLRAENRDLQADNRHLRDRVAALEATTATIALPAGGSS